MKKFLMAIALCLVCAANVFGQFTYKVVDNGFDEPFKKAICYSTQNSPDKGLLCFEEGDEHPFIYIAGSYFCDDSFFIDCSFDNGDKFRLYGDCSSDSKDVFIREPKDVEGFYARHLNYTDEVWENFWKDMRCCSLVKFRVNESHCDTDVYYFSLKNSSAAIDFTTKK